MARRNDSLLDALSTLPWRMNVVLAIIIFFPCKYILPAIPVSNPFLEGIAHQALPTLAPLLALLLLVAAGFSAFNASRKRRLLDNQKDIQSIRSISWWEFEELVGEAYRRKGYHVIENGGGGPDGGVDLILKKDDETLLVQCKNWRTLKVGVKVVRELYGVIAGRDATGGIIISSGNFTRETRRFARRKALEMIDGDQLVKMIEEVKKTPSTATVTEQKDENLCPLCGSEMVLRVARKGPHSGEKFWGCSCFPKCRGVRPHIVQS
jgi:restriction system protein